MIFLKSKVVRLIEDKDYQGLNQLLVAEPILANEGITIPYDSFCRTKAHPLHRICDIVFTNRITENESIQLASLFLEHGAHIDGDKVKNEGTPLLAAASLHAEQLGIFYVENGADIDYSYQNNGESALHWAAFCGRDKLVECLIKANCAIDNLDKTYNSTPLGWAIHSLQSNDEGNKHNQLECIKLLLKNSADTRKLDQDKSHYLQKLSKSDPALEKLLV
ncbi:MAG: ankyrin repeat protein [Saprospiraceae bacterium]|jgi:ankyrin repeat protein